LRVSHHIHELGDHFEFGCCSGECPLHRAAMGGGRIGVGQDECNETCRNHLREMGAGSEISPVGATDGGEYIDPSPGRAAVRFLVRKMLW